MVDDKRNTSDEGLRQANNLSELDPETSVDPLTDTTTVSQQESKDEEIVPLPETQKGVRTGDFDTTTGAAHPTADSGADKGVDG